MLWLKFYTHHGQKLELPDYNNVPYTEAAKDAKKRKFELIVDDSIYVVGMKGGIIRDQNPKKGSKVKENRKIYVVVSKYNPDKIKIEDLPSLYGRNYETKKKELSLLDINSRILGYEYDKGDPNYILKVYYKGKPIIVDGKPVSGIEIEKGSTLDFILSKQSGGITDLPNLRCMSASQALFMIESRHLLLGSLYLNDNLITDPTGYVVDQSPTASDAIPMDTEVDLFLQAELPEDCN
ncbi:MAG: PASTA domain-containing protein [Saprospiraceae bacterium]